MVGTLFVIVVNLVVLFIFYLVFRRRIDQALQTENILKEIRSEVDQMIVDLNETTDRNVGLVEELLSRLSTKITEADRRIVVLKKEAERTRTADSVYTQLRSATPPPQAPKKQHEEKAEPSVEKKSTREQVLELYRSGFEAREIASRLKKTLGEVELIISLGVNRA